MKNSKTSFYLFVAKESMLLIHFSTFFMTVICHTMFSYMAHETEPFGLDLVCRLAFHTSRIKKYFSKDSASQKYSRPLQLQTYTGAKDTLTISPFDLKANGFTTKRQRLDLSYSQLPMLILLTPKPKFTCLSDSL